MMFFGDVGETNAIIHDFSLRLQRTIFRTIKLYIIHAVAYAFENLP
jgi:hypothetical protein